MDQFLRTCSRSFADLVEDGRPREPEQLPMPAVETLQANLQGVPVADLISAYGGTPMAPRPPRAPLLAAPRTSLVLLIWAMVSKEQHLDNIGQHLDNNVVEAMSKYCRRIAEVLSSVVEFDASAT